MMRNFLLAFSITLAATGCGVIYKQPIYQGNLIAQNAVAQLQVGQSKAQVAALLGTPSIADRFHDQRWDYTSSRRINRRGQVEVKNFTVFFANDRVQRWEGDYFPNQDAELARNSSREFGRNLSREKSRRR